MKKGILLIFCSVLILIFSCSIDNTTHSNQYYQNKSIEVVKGKNNFDHIHILEGDFDGDGKKEAWRINTDGMVYVYASKGKIHQFQLKNWSGNNVKGSYLGYITVGDFNNDDKDEIWAFQKDCAWHYVWQLEMFQRDGRMQNLLAGGQNYNNFHYDDIHAVLSGNFDSDKQKEIRVFLKNTNKNYIFKLWHSSPIVTHYMENSIGAPVASNYLKYILVGDFNGDGIDEIRGLQKDCAWNYVWGLSNISEFDGPLYTRIYKNAEGHETYDEVNINNLSYVVAGDFDGDGTDEIRGLQKDTHWNYIWGEGFHPENDWGFIINSNENMMVNSFTHVFVDDIDGDSFDELITFQSDKYYVWDKNSNCVKNGLITNNNDVADLPYEKPWITPTDSIDQPVVMAAYFLRYETEIKPLGDPIAVITPSENYQHIKEHTQFDSTNKHYICPPGVQEHCFYGPYISKSALKAQFNYFDDTTNEEKAKLNIKIDFELKIDDNSFNSEPIGVLDIYSYEDVEHNSVDKVLFQRKLYAQDFRNSNTPQKFSFSFPSYVFDKAELRKVYTDIVDDGKEIHVEFRFFSYGKRTVTLKKVYATPWKRNGPFNYWGNPLWRPGTDPMSHYRFFDPNWIITSDFSKVFDENRIFREIEINKIEDIKRWRRDIAVGFKGDYPYIGPYDQLSNGDQLCNGLLLDYHMKQAHSAGINAFKVYRYFPKNGEYYKGTRCTDLNLPNVYCDFWNMLERAKNLKDPEGNKIDFYLVINDSKSSLIKNSQTTTGENKDYSFDDCMTTVEMLAKNGFFSHPNYLKINGRPVYDVPSVYLSPDDIKDLTYKLNEKYQNNDPMPHSKGLYIMMTAMTTFPSGSGYPARQNGPYNMQEIFIDNYSSLIKEPHKYLTSTQYPSSVDDLKNCRCLYDPSEAGSGYCIFLATLLERSIMSEYRNLTGVTSLYDWTAKGALMYPQMIEITGYDDNNKAIFDTDYFNDEKKGLMRKAFKTYVTDAHKFNYGATITISPGHSKIGNFDGNGTLAEVNRYESGKENVELRWNRIVESALSAHPDIINIENWNGYGEGVQIEPAEGYINNNQKDPDMFLKILAEKLGKTYVAPKIPCDIVDSIRRPYIPTHLRKDIPGCTWD